MPGPFFSNSFIPNRWLAHPHVQTIVADVFPALPDFPARLDTLSVKLPDGDTLISEFLPGTTQTVSILCHGLSGDSRSKYIVRGAYHLNHLGHHIVLFNHRNCGAGLGYATKPYNSGSGNDIGQVVLAVRKKFPDHKIVVYGFSLSANALLNLISTENEKDLWPDAAMAVNPPANLARASELLSMGLNRIYEKNFIYTLKSSIKKFSNDPEIQKKLSILMKIRDFDNVYTAPLSGYKDAEDYYTQCSTYKKLDRIQTPTLVMTSDDDPFVDVADFRNQKTSAQVHIHITRGGGHLGYISQNKTPLGNHRWLDYAVVEFAKRCQALFPDATRI